MHEQPLRWWLRPVRKVERVGEQSAVVCHWEYISPLSAIFCSVGMLMPPPNGDHAARPVSSYRTIRMFGAPSCALASVYGPQSGLESRTSSLMTPLKGFFDMTWPPVSALLSPLRAHGPEPPRQRTLDCPAGRRFWRPDRLRVNLSKSSLREIASRVAGEEVLLSTYRLALASKSRLGSNLPVNRTGR